MTLPNLTHSSLRTNRRTRCRYVAGTTVLAVVTALCSGTAGAQAPDAAGRLRFVVRAADTGEPVANAVIFLDDPTGAEFRRALYTGADGTVTTGPLAPHAWRFTVLRPGFQKASGAATVRAGATVAVACR